MVLLSNNPVLDPVIPWGGGPGFKYGLASDVVLGLRVAVDPVERGALDAYTGTSQTSKIKRLLDKRK